MNGRADRFRLLLTVLLAALLVISAAFLLWGWLTGRFSSVEGMREYIGAFGLLGPVVLTVIQALQVVLPVLPGFFGCIVGASLFGAAGGFWCSYIGISAGSIAAFLLAKRFGVPLVKKMVPMEKYSRWVEWVNGKRSCTAVLFLAILLPLAPDDFLCYFSGLTGMSTRRFTSIIVAGKPWCILAYSLFFAYIIK